MKFLVKDILKLVNHPSSKKLRVLEKNFAIDDNGHIFFLLTPNNIIEPRKYFWEDIVQNRDLIDSIETDSLEFMLQVMDELRRARATMKNTSVEI
jgi:hypothetical protein